METCEDILRTKGNDVFAIAPEATIFEAVEAMCGWRVGALLVGGVAVPRGIISERDVMARVVLQRLSFEPSVEGLPVEPEAAGGEAPVAPAGLALHYWLGSHTDWMKAV